MMERLKARGEALARQAQSRQATRVRDRLQQLLGDAAVSVVDAGVLVRGRNIVQRWLKDPGFRFFGRGYE